MGASVFTNVRNQFPRVCKGKAVCGGINIGVYEFVDGGQDVLMPRHILQSIWSIFLYPAQTLSVPTLGRLFACPFANNSNNINKNNNSDPQNLHTKVNYPRLRPVGWPHSSSPCSCCPSRTSPCYAPPEHPIPFHLQSLTCCPIYSRRCNSLLWKMAAVVE